MSINAELNLVSIHFYAEDVVEVEKAEDTTGAILKLTLREGKKVHMFFTPGSLLKFKEVVNAL